MIRSISYYDVLQKAAEATGRIFADLSVQEAGLFKGFINTRLKEMWEAWNWPDLMMGEERKFRADWDAGTTYAAGAEVYFLPAKKYYQSLRGTNLNHEPATGTPLVETSAWWAECATGYSGTDYDAATAYAVGAKVLYSVTGRYYQKHTASAAGVAPTDTTRWGVLTPFNRYVAWEQTGKSKLGDVLEVYDRDPEIFEGALALTWRETPLGIHVYDNVPTCWPRWRKILPFLKGNAFSATPAYAVGDQVYYQVTSASGIVSADFYECITATTAGDLPSTDKWAKVEIPFIFGEWLIHASAADMLSKDGKDDWSRDEMVLATGMKLHELDKQERQKGQEPPLRVKQRDSSLYSWGMTPART
ncbi:MAG TPA: hypothetical protein VGD41_05730 [Pyrinomonadaceae bacterium]